MAINTVTNGYVTNGYVTNGYVTLQRPKVCDWPEMTIDSTSSQPVTLVTSPKQFPTGNHGYDKYTLWCQAVYVS